VSMPAREPTSTCTPACEPTSTCTPACEPTSTATPATEPTAATRTVLLVGAGRRVRNNWLPAIDRLDSRVELAGLWSRTRASAEAAAGPWSAPVVDQLSDVLGSVDTVMVSVATPAVSGILEQLLPEASRLRLVLDTPVFGDPRHLVALRLLRRFKQVLVAEDYAQYPQWVLTRQAIAAGLIGEPRHVRLDHSGFRYHGLALIRSVFGYPFARRMRRRRDGAFTRLDFMFGAGRAGTILEPYEAARGTTVVTGSDGVIAAGPGTPLVNPGRLPVHTIEPVGRPTAPEAFDLGPHTIALPELPALLEADVPDRTVFNALKTCGLLRILEGLWSDNPPAYGYRDALYDHLTTAWLRAAPGAVDPLAAARRNFVGLIETAARIRPLPRPSVAAA
jgi:hypothetical protein